MVIEVMSVLVVEWGGNCGDEDIAVIGSGGVVC